MCPNRTVFVIDDDTRLRDSVCALVTSMGAQARGFASAEEFLASDTNDERGVAVVDLRMPGMSGLDLQELLRQRRQSLPIIMLTAYARTPATVRAIQAGAVTMIDKPYHDNDLWDAIRTALEKEDAAWSAQQRRKTIQDQLATLTPDERRVADLLVAGRQNKAIAMELGIALRTVEKRRHAVLHKMNAGSIAQLVGIYWESRRLEELSSNPADSSTADARGSTTFLA
jgi:FixJ family two-component response regulator